MATTTDIATSARKTANKAGDDKEQLLEDQVKELQNDLKGIADTLSKLTGEKVNDAQRMAKTEVKNLQHRAENVMEDVQEQAGVLEKQLKDTIREKPLTAVATAAGIGFLLALLSR